MMDVKPTKGKPRSDKGKPRGRIGNAGKGRAPGSVNKATANAREAIAAFVDGNAERLNGWLDDIAATDGSKAAFQCFMDVVEYHVPKLARTELTGKDGGSIETNATLIIQGTKAGG